jgi:hypothetical protein
VRATGRLQKAFVAFAISATQALPIPAFRCEAVRGLAPKP